MMKVFLENCAGDPLKPINLKLDGHAPDVILWGERAFYIIQRPSAGVSPTYREGRVHQHVEPDERAD